MGMMGQYISVKLDPGDNTKVLVTSMPAGIAWQELKDHFGEAGGVHYANIRSTEHFKGKGIKTVRAPSVGKSFGEPFAANGFHGGSVSYGGGGPSGSKGGFAAEPASASG